MSMVRALLRLLVAVALMMTQPSSGPRSAAAVPMVMVAEEVAGYLDKDKRAGMKISRRRKEKTAVRLLRQMEATRNQRTRDGRRRRKRRKRRSIKRTVRTRASRMRKRRRRTTNRTTRRSLRTYLVGRCPLLHRRLRRPGRFRRPRKTMTLAATRQVLKRRRPQQLSVLPRHQRRLHLQIKISQILRQRTSHHQRHLQQRPPYR
mmetsp:Transcript_117578/g.219878  ORF Transcript_117578/g.219878 Transcript_117578/m.219878 type:complete len:204 (-) Transcript_117578:342-953(-)